MFKKGDIVVSKLNGRSYVLGRFSTRLGMWAVTEVHGNDQSYLPESWMEVANV